MTPARQRAILVALGMAADDIAAFDDAQVADEYAAKFDASGRLITEGDEPVTLEQAKAQLKPVGNDDDALIEGYITAARETVEGKTGLILKRRTIVQTFDGLSERMRLYAWPVVPETLVLRYQGADGVDVEIDDARMIAWDRPALLAPAFATRWPYSYGRVRASFVAGCAGAEDVPMSLRQAILLLVQAEYDPVADREKLEQAADRLCQQHKRWAV